MLKLMGCVLVAGGCTAWGFFRSAELSSCVRLLEEFIQMIQVLERELTLFRPSLSSLLKRMAQDRDARIVSMLNACGTEIEKGNPFTTVWEQEVGALPLPQREKGLLCSLGQVLGQYDDAGQVQVAAQIRAELEACAEQLRKDSLVRGRMYRMLGATIGGFLVLSLL